jgi:hypothetical protein
MHIFSAVNTPVTGTFTARSLLFTLHSSLFTLRILREKGVRPKPASSQGSTAHPGRDGPGAAWEERGVVHGVRRRVMDSNSHCKRQFTRAARRPQRPAFPRRRLRRCGSTRSGRPDVSFATKAPHAAQAVNPRALRPASGSRASG